MQTDSIQMLHRFLALEAQLVVCSAVIKEIKIQTSFTKTHSSGLSAKINTQRSLQCSPKSLFTHLDIMTGFSVLVWRDAETGFQVSAQCFICQSERAPYPKPDHASAVPLLVKKTRF